MSRQPDLYELDANVALQQLISNDEMTESHVTNQASFPRVASVQIDVLLMAKTEYMMFERYQQVSPP